MCLGVKTALAVVVGIEQDLLREVGFVGGTGSGGVTHRSTNMREREQRKRVRKEEGSEENRIEEGV